MTIEQSQPPQESLSSFATLIGENFTTIKDHFPKLAAAAEAVHQTFDALLQKHMKPNAQSWSSMTRGILAVGVHAAWIDSYLFASAGHIASGWSNLRRAIELVCYASKMKSDKRAQDWWNQRNDEKAGRRFASSCSIPLCYENEEYRLLRPLILAHEESNYYGSHGDVESLWYNYKSIKDGKFDFKYQSNLKEGLLFSGYVTLYGNRMLAALREALRDCIENTEAFDQLLNFSRDLVNEARSQLKQIERGTKISVIDLEGTDNDERFLKLIAEAKKRKKPADSGEAAASESQQ